MQNALNKASLPEVVLYYTQKCMNDNTAPILKPKS